MIFDALGSLPLGATIENINNAYLVQTLESSNVLSNSIVSISASLVKNVDNIVVVATGSIIAGINCSLNQIAENATTVSNTDILITASTIQTLQNVSSISNSETKINSYLVESLNNVISIINSTLSIKSNLTSNLNDSNSISTAKIIVTGASSNRLESVSNTSNASVSISANLISNLSDVVFSGSCNVYFRPATISYYNFDSSVCYSYDIVLEYANTLGIEGNMADVFVVDADITDKKDFYSSVCDYIKMEANL